MGISNSSNIDTENKEEDVVVEEDLITTLAVGEDGA